MHFDFDAFLNSVKYLDREDILDMAYKKHKSLDKPSTAYSTADRLAMQSSISGLIYWLERKQCLPSMTAQDFAKLKPLCENLVRKNQIEKETLQLFA